MTAKPTASASSARRATVMSRISPTPAARRRDRRRANRSHYRAKSEGIPEGWRPGLAAAALVVARARQYDAAAGGDPVPDDTEASRQQDASSSCPTAIEPLVDDVGAQARHAMA